MLPRAGRFLAAKLSCGMKIIISMAWHEKVDHMGTVFFFFFFFADLLYLFLFFSAFSSIMIPKIV